MGEPQEKDERATPEDLVETTAGAGAESPDKNAEKATEKPSEANVSAEEVSLRDTLDAGVDTLVDDGAARGAGDDGHASEAPPPSETESLKPGRLSKTLLALEASAPGSIYDTTTADDTKADPLIGLVVADRYRILERIGRGGMGIVYKVEHIRIGKLLAMKLLAGELSTNKEIVRRFKLEALTVSKLSCPHTVQVFDYGVWSHLTYLVMELVEGHDLSLSLRRMGPLPFTRLGRLMVHVCASLAEAHDKGITHRDIKPENIMIVSDPRGVEAAKVLDFGLAKLRENAELNEVTLQGAVVGTPYFMSPEQVYGEDVDGRTDIYSLGAVMFRALTGTYPFQAKSPMGMFTKHLTEAPPSACERAPELGIPRGISDAIQKCMAKEPDKRFQTIESVRDMLLDELNLLPLSSSERVFFDEPSGERLIDSGERKQKRRERVAVAVGVPELAASQLATRQELEGYEKSLRRNRYVGWAIAACVSLGAAGAGAYFYGQGQKFTGAEKEPNNSAADANALPLNRAVTGYLGRRIEPKTADRDFYTFAVNDEAHITLELTAIPNLATCLVLYRVGFQQPLAHYCTGAAGQDLLVSNLSIESGSYYVAVTQEVEPHDAALDRGGVGRFVYENISDPYQITVSAAQPEPNAEVEPNDTVDAHQTLAAGGELMGSLSWVGDEDVYCVGAAFDGAITWEVRDGKRRPGAVLEATPSLDGAPLPLVRIHGDAKKPFGKPVLDADAESPWMSPVYDTQRGVRCLRLRLTSDPWTGDGGPPLPDATPYTVRVLHAD